jgi:hypothetical protein
MCGEAPVDSRAPEAALPAVVVFHPRDRATIRQCVQGIRDSLCLSDITLISCEEGRRDAKELGVRWLSEDEVVPGLCARSFDSWRWGWYFQQILKLGAAQHIESQRYLVVDADTVFLRRVEFVDLQGRTLFARGTEYHRPYFDTFAEMFGFEAQREYSFITHHMCFERQVVAEMLGCMGPSGTWWESIAGYLAPRPPHMSDAQFSEYESYGHFMKNRHPDRMRVRDLAWTVWPSVPDERDLCRLARRYDFVSAHAHIRDHPMSLARRMKWYVRELLGV